MTQNVSATSVARGIMSAGKTDKSEKSELKCVCGPGVEDQNIVDPLKYFYLISLSHKHYDYDKDLFF